MTLLETFTALVILGLSAVGYLEVFQSAARAVGGTRDWIAAAAAAEQAIENALGSGPAERPPVAMDARTRIERRTWSASVDDIVATVRLSDGRTLTIHRLARSR